MDAKENAGHPEPTIGPGQTLIIDADDTLWENNVYFERAAGEFLDFLNHSTLSRDEARAVIDEIEHANLGNDGYGSAAFGRNLTAAYHRLAERDIQADDLAVVMGFGERILSQEIELLTGVVETLAWLAPRNRLVLFTKGNREEQQLKIDRSGLADRFHHAAIVPEKHRAAYEELTRELDADPARTWMIGNSPKSDINPALAAGLNAVFVPHPDTWSLEYQEIAAPADSDRLLVVERFADLRQHFAGGAGAA